MLHQTSSKVKCFKYNREIKYLKKRFYGLVIVVIFILVIFYYSDVEIQLQEL